MSIPNPTFVQVCFMAEIPFSKRYGHFPTRDSITVYDDAPESLRKFLMYAAHQHLSFLAMYVHVSDVLNVPTGGRNVSEESCRDDVESLMNRASWFRIYDIIERFWIEIRAKRDGEVPAAKFATKINDFFIENGIGWQLTAGQVVTRGDEVFETGVKTAQAELKGAGRPTAARRIHEALQDLSGRPEADYAGDISHALSALEAVAKDVTAQETLTLGQLIAQGKLNGLLPSENIRQSVMYAWKYANDEGARHGKEGKEPERDEAEFIVGLAATVVTYLNRRHR
jgi:hypothetical protein